MPTAWYFSLEMLVRSSAAWYSRAFAVADGSRFNLARKKIICKAPRWLSVKEMHHYCGSRKVLTFTVLAELYTVTMCSERITHMQFPVSIWGRWTIKLMAVLSWQRDNSAVCCCNYNYKDALHTLRWNAIYLVAVRSCRPKMQDRKMTDQIRVLHRDLLALFLKTSNIIMFVRSHTTMCFSFL